MKITSAECNKLLSDLTDKKQRLLTEENKLCTYNAAVGEDPESLRPDYNFINTQKEINNLDAEIMRTKHQLNLFNTRTEILPGLTIDQALIKLPQLTEKRNKLRRMMNRVAKERGIISGNVIDYMYTSYDPAEAVEMYDEVVREIRDIQLALDKVNNTEVFEI